MLTAIVAGIICYALHVLVMLNKQKYALAIIILFIPMAERTVLIGQFRFSFVSLLIIVCLISTMLKKQHLNRGIECIPYNSNIALICLCVVSSLISYLASDIDKSIAVNDISAVHSLTCYVSSTIAGLGLYYLLTREMKTLNKIEFYSLCYLGSLFFLGLVVFIITVIHIKLPNFLNPYSVVKAGGVAETIPTGLYSAQDRAFFAGYIGYIENFAEYLFTMFALGYLLFRASANRLLMMSGFGACVMSIGFGIFCGSKAFLIMIVIFMILVSSLLRKGSTLTHILVLASILVFIYLFIFDLTTSTFLFKRYVQLSERYVRLGGLNTVSDLPIFMNREGLFNMFWVIIRAGGLFGLGPFVIQSIENSNIVFHNLYYALILNYGIIGLCVFCHFFLKIIFGLGGVTSASSQVNTIRAMFLSLFIVLLIEQIKLTAFRIPTGVISWWFLFALFASFINICQRLSRPCVTKRRVIPA